MSETFDKQLERVQWLADGGHVGGGDGSCGELEIDDCAAIKAVLDQRARLRAALDRVHGILQSDALAIVHRIADLHGYPYTGDAFTVDDYLAAIHPETPVGEIEQR